MKKILSLVLVMALALTGCSQSTSASVLKDGTYTGTGKGLNGDVKVEVVIKSDVIESVTVTEHQETPGVSDPAIEGVPSAIVEKNSAVVDTVSGATFTSKGIIEAVKDCINQAGGDGETFGVSEGDGEKTEKTAKTEDVDMLVVGAGLSGMSAALSAHENGVENIVVIEKQAAAGGTTSLAGGFFIYVNEETYPEFYDYWVNERMSVSGVEAKYFNEDRFEYVVPKTADTVEWLKGQGVNFAEGTSNIFGAYEAASGTAGGAGIVTDLVAACERAGIKVITNCKGTELVADDNGAVVGAVAETADEIITYNAKAVVLACGGSGSNEEITAEKSPKVANAMTINTGAAGNTGDGLAMAVAVGAVEYEEFFSSLACQTIDPAVENGADLPYDTQLIVNAKGARFVAEDASNISVKYDAMASAMIQDGNAPFWTIYSDKNAREVVAILDAGVEAGTVVSAASIRELAEAMGADADTLTKAYDGYKAAVEAGKDDEFGKAAEKLTSDWIDGEKFYAVKIFPTTFGSQGGVKTDFDGRVLNAEGEAIKGLYAVGEMSNREFYNENYVLAASLGLYSTVGRLCGVAVAGDIAG